MDQPGQVVGPPGTEDLAVAGVMAHEGELGGHHRQIGGVDQLQLAHDDQAHQAGGQQDQVEADPDRVPAPAPLQQPRLPSCRDSWVYSPQRPVGTTTGRAVDSWPGLTAWAPFSRGAEATVRSRVS